MQVVTVGTHAASEAPASVPIPPPVALDPPEPVVLEPPLPAVPGPEPPVPVTAASVPVAFCLTPAQAASNTAKTVNKNGVRGARDLPIVKMGVRRGPRRLARPEADYRRLAPACTMAPDATDQVIVPPVKRQLRPPPGAGSSSPIG